MTVHGHVHLSRTRRQNAPHSIGDSSRPGYRESKAQLLRRHFQSQRLTEQKPSLESGMSHCHCQILVAHEQLSATLTHCGANPSAIAAHDGSSVRASEGAFAETEVWVNTALVRASIRTYLTEDGGMNVFETLQLLLELTKKGRIKGRMPLVNFTMGSIRHASVVRVEE
jgi:hypothetical protein